MKVIAFEVEGLPVAQDNEDVTKQVIIPLFGMLDVVIVGLFGPALTPFNCHW